MCHKPPVGTVDDVNYEGYPEMKGIQSGRKGRGNHRCEGFTPLTAQASLPATSISLCIYRYILAGQKLHEHEANEMNV